MDPAQPVPFQPSQMAARKAAYYRFARSNMLRLFKPDGTYQPESEPDARIAFWLYPALVSSPDAAERDFANVIYAAAGAWSGKSHLRLSPKEQRRWGAWDVFTTSSIAVNLARERPRMTPDLVQRSEEHLDKYVVRDGGRLPCSGANDYMFHGYNDNMPAMSVRAMLLAGEMLNRKDYIDQGMFYLQGLCAHFERRGLLSEYTSGTYTPITLTCLMDVAEYSGNAAAREMAVACANRVLLDVFGHWHRGIGGIGGAMSRAYTADLTETLSTMNALIWYLTGDPRCVNPIEALAGIDTFEGHVHHGRNFAFNLSQFAELLSPSYLTAKKVAGTGDPPDAKMAEDIRPTVLAGVRDFARAPRRYPYEMYALTDSGQGGLLGGVKEIQTRAFHQSLYALATVSDTASGQAGQQATLHAVLARVAQPRGWKDRIALWHKTIAGALEQGDMEPASSGSVAEAGHINDVGLYHSLQKGGSALVLGALGPALLGKRIQAVKFSLIFGTFLHQPDAVVQEKLWHFLRFGEVYVGVRMAAMQEEKRLPVRRMVKNKLLRIEVPLVRGRPVKVDQNLREWTDFGYVLEIASRAECGSWAQFRTECLACTWEFYHCFYRNSRYQSRHGELQIIDSVAAGTIRFMAIDGVVEPRVKLAATGLKPKLAELFPDGHRIKQHRLAYRSSYIGSPFYAVNKTEPLLEHILAADLSSEK